MIDPVVHDSDPDASAAPHVVWSASDLVRAARCEFATVRRLDEVLGRAPRLAAEADDMLERAARLGDAHESRVLARYVDRRDPAGLLTARGSDDVAGAAGRVVTVAAEAARGAGGRRERLEQAHGLTLALLEEGAAVVHQASFFDGEFHGLADFIVRSGEGADAIFTVVDAKLARSAKVDALLQLGAYADQLEAAGFPVAPEARLVLGTGAETSHRLADLLPVFRERRVRLRSLIAERVADAAPVAWGDPRYSACGACDHCTAEVVANDDVLQVAGMRRTQRDRLRAAGITTMTELARATRGPRDMSAATFEKLRRQAAMQTGLAVVDGTVVWTERDADGQEVEQQRSWTVVDPGAVERLPAPSPGDIFFDFEGDPLWTDAAGQDWGLDYLFGLVERPTEPGSRAPFHAFWAHDLTQERAALVAFVDYVTERRRRYPDLHVYHYAPYEKTHLVSIAARHGVYEEEVDDLLREGVLVDLYATVRESVRISTGSYSIKKLEPLYMGEHLRSGDVTDAAASIVAYATYGEARDSGDEARADELLAGIRDYNRYDCDSTLVLLEWLRWAAERAGGAATGGAFRPDPYLGLDPHVLGVPAGAAGAVPDGSDDSTDDRSAALTDARAAVLAVEGRVREIVGEDRAARSADEDALALLGAAAGYYAREDKAAWREHFARLVDPVDEWPGSDNFVVESARPLTGWSKPPRARTLRRTVELRGRLDAGREVREGEGRTALYDAPWPSAAKDSVDGHRAAIDGLTVESTSRDGDVHVLVVQEKAPRASTGGTSCRWLSFRGPR
ncbi:TM0106 family RecB-like putative nuclease [Paraoerskovia sediminicola]|uniref:TM0106 family RecB-like putative nuclease n=1 Tax=Paraoerskovia sediminicola TaxID=1138587 RepID=UPI0025725420|nr:TM0106 family RecB-like putative nuclease [Paraoerskovia sediminicola]